MSAAECGLARPGAALAARSLRHRSVVDRCSRRRRLVLLALDGHAPRPARPSSGPPRRATGRSRRTSTRPPAQHLDSDTAMRSTRPNTTVEARPAGAGTGGTRRRRHSSDTGDSATRGRPYESRRLPLDLRPRRTRPSRVGSRSPSRSRAERASSVTTLTTNSPVSSMLRRLSLRPTEVNCTTGGSWLDTVKNECGARLSTPAADVVDTHAIGRGTTTWVSHEYVLSAARPRRGPARDAAARARSPA